MRAWRQTPPLVGHAEALMKANGVMLVRGGALLDGAGAFGVGGGRSEARSLVVATGSEPARIPRRASSTRSPQTASSRWTQVGQRDDVRRGLGDHRPGAAPTR